MTHQEPTVFIKMIRLLLRPLIRMLLRHGVTYPMFIELVKAGYVEVAEQSGEANKSPTDSRISVQTGLNRKEVKRLRHQVDEASLALKFQQAGIGAQLMAQWLSDPQLIDEKGRPLPIDRLDKDNQTLSFERLVKSVTKDVHPRSILDDWLARGFAKLDSDDRVHLTQSAYVPSEDQSEKLYFAQKNLTAHLNAVAHNLESNPPMFERAVYHHKVPADALPQLDEWSRQASMTLLTEFNAKAQALAKQAGDSTETHHLQLGVYIYRSDLDEMQQESRS